MKRVRVIPVLLLDNGRAVVTRKFQRPVYIGDPLNAIRILNDKEVDELFILDITRDLDRRPDFDLIAQMASESFMPVAYGGHIRQVKDAELIIKSGIEKLCFNSALFANADMIRELSGRFGRQSIIASIDYRRNAFGKIVVRAERNSRSISLPLATVVKKVEEYGVGEILLHSIDRDGTLKGYDLAQVRAVSGMVDVPVVPCGGAATLEDMRHAITCGASAAAAAAMFYFKGSFDAVLINYPNQVELKSRLYDLLG